jgi:cytochrome c peroxidase
LLSDEKFYRLISSKDKGRGGINGKKTDLYRIRTPSLRNIARTGPYMHDGSQKTLADVVTVYYRGSPAEFADGLTPDFEPLVGNSFSEISDVIAFLESLTGDEPKISPPELP